jgi:hypothetical protein
MAQRDDEVVSAGGDNLVTGNLMMLFVYSAILFFVLNVIVH